MIKNVLLIGAGAVGTYFCGRLATQGVKVAVVARSDFDYVAKHGYNVKSIGGDFHFEPSGVYRNAGEYPIEPDLVVLATKNLPDIDSAKLLRGALKNSATPLLIIQNGIGIESPIQQAFPYNEIISAIAYIGVTKVGPGQIVHAGAGKLIIGRFGSADTATARQIADLFITAKVPTQVSEQILKVRYQKLLWNLPFNPISVLGGKLLTNQMVSGAVGDLARALMREVLATAHAEGIDFPESIIEDNIIFTRDFPPYKTSMLIDFEHQRPLEVEAIVGNLLKIAAKHQLHLPYCEAIYALLQAADCQNRLARN